MSAIVEFAERKKLVLEHPDWAHGPTIPFTSPIAAQGVIDEAILEDLEFVVIHRGDIIHLVDKPKTKAVAVVVRSTFVSFYDYFPDCGKGAR